jgi:hypothetical protein
LRRSPLNFTKKQLRAFLADDPVDCLPTCSLTTPYRISGAFPAGRASWGHEQIDTARTFDPDLSGAMARRHLGWQALAEAVAPGARVTRLRRLAGAGMTDAYDVTLDRTPGRVVVKLYRDGDGTAPLEWSRLEFAQRVALPVPEPIVADLESV